MFASALESFQVSRVASVQRAANAAFLTWGFVVSYFAFLIITTPLMIKDIVGEADAAAWQGTLTSLTAAAGLVLCALVGYASDRWGRLVFMRIWVVCFFVAGGFVLYSEISRTLAGLIFARLVPFSVYSTLTFALTSDLSRDSSEVLKAHQALGATFSAAMLLGNIAAGGLTLMFPNRAWILLLGCGLTSTAVWCAFNYLESPAEPTTSAYSASPVSSPVTAGNNGSGAGGAAGRIHSRGASRGSGTELDRFGGVDDGDDSSALVGEQHHSNHNINSTSSSASATTTTGGGGGIAFPFAASPLGVPDKIPDPERQDAGGGGGKSSISLGEGIVLLKRDPLLRNIILAFSLLRVSNVNSFAIFILFTNHRLGWTIAHVSAYLIVLGCVGAAAQAYFLKVMNQLSEKVTKGEMTSKEAGELVLKVFGYLLALTVPTCAWYGVATSTTMLFVVTVPAGVCAVLPGIFTAKIAAISKESNLTGWALGLVGTTQNLIESVLGIVFGFLLRTAIRNYDDDSLMFGMPYYVNAGSYAAVCVIMWYSHSRYGTMRATWMDFEVAVQQPGV